MAEGSSSSTEMLEDEPVMRILLVGRNTPGKSSFGNTILGENKFERQDCDICEGQTKIGEKQVHVIYCPDLLDPDVDEEKLKEKLLSVCSGGLSSVLLTIPLEEPVQNEEKILDDIKQLFGPEVQIYTMILFTCGYDQTTKEHLEDQADLQRLITECGGKFWCFNNKSTSENRVNDFLQKIDGIEGKNGGKFRTKQMKRSSKGSFINFSQEDPGPYGS